MAPTGERQEELAGIAPHRDLRLLTAGEACAVIEHGSYQLATGAELGDRCDELHALDKAS